MHVSKDGHQNDMCLKEIELICVQNLLTILGSIGNEHNQGDLYDHSKRKRIFKLIINKIPTHTSSKFYEDIDYGQSMDLLIVFH